MMTIRELPAILQEKAKKEINENPQRVNSDISAIRTWLQKQPHLHSVNPSNQLLIAFLRGSKFSLERCKEKLDMYYTLRTIVPEFLSNRDPLNPRIQEILKLGVFLPLQKCAEIDSSRICIVRVGAFDPTKYSLSDLIKIAFMITEIMMLEDDNFTVSGEEVIIDMKNVGVNVLSQWTPALAKKVITCFEKAFPVRLKGNHILNTPIGFDTAYSIFKAFLGAKLKKRILKLWSEPIVEGEVSVEDYRQVDDVAIGSPVSPIVADCSVFIEDFEEKALLTSSVNPRFYNRVICDGKYLAVELQHVKQVLHGNELRVPRLRHSERVKPASYPQVKVHNQNYAALYKEIPKRVLPKEYDGEDGGLQELTDYWQAKVESYRNWFLQEETAKSDESKRPDKPKTTSSLFGVEGSFRKLDVD